MVTKDRHEKGITTIQVSTMTLKRLRVLKAENDFAHFDELINKALDEYEGFNTEKNKGGKRK